MRAIVIFESMFGNTEEVARAIADGLAAHLPADAVDVFEVGAAPTSVAQDDLLVIGGPTHAFSMSRESTREDAATKTTSPLVSQGEGVREWLERLTVPPGGHPAVAAFDTKVSRPRLPGSAAKAIERRLRKMGFTIVHPATTFHVHGMEGPVEEGELEKARQFGARLASGLTG